LKPRLLFVSTRFLFPVDSGGKIRTTQILRGLKGGDFEVILASPAPPGHAREFDAQLLQVCDRFASWPAGPTGLLRTLRRTLAIASALPLPVASDRSRAGRRVVASELARRPEVAVFDFPHAAVLAPPQVGVPAVLFTHNIEAEIFGRHAKVAANPLMRRVWQAQYNKMLRYEGNALRAFDAVIAVSERDGAFFRQHYGISEVDLIPTGVDLDFFGFAAPADNDTVVFIGSMDWPANVDGIEFLLQQVWPLVLARRPSARMLIVGRAPPAGLVSRARGLGFDWTFTGFVEDVRPCVRGAALSVIPLRVGGGTRLKVFEAMAMGCPVVSTRIGVEGLPVADREHYRRADSPAELSTAIVELLEDRIAAHQLALRARRLVESEFGYRRAAREFERICHVARRRRPADSERNP
jgi:glycosyltransferase involved in cell wall biosynthesis